MSSRVTLLVEMEGVDVDGADWDGAEREGGDADPDYLALNYASFCLTVVVSMEHI